jgi:hypothetical protein
MTLPKKPTTKPLNKPPTRSKVPNVDFTAELQAAQKALQPAAKRLECALAAFDPAGLPIGALSDFLYVLRAAKGFVPSLASAFDDALAPAIKATEDHFVATLKVGESSGVQGGYSRTQISESTIPVIKAENWVKFFAYVSQTKQWELLTHKVSTDAVRERWANKKQVKFVDRFIAKKVSCTRLSGKGA